MKKSRFTDSQIIAALKRVEAGLTVPEICRELGISSATFYKSRAKFGGMDTSMMARARLDSFLDAEGRYEIGQEVLPVDALKFKDSRKYPERLKDAMESTGETDALVVMGGTVHGISVVTACFEFEFMGGSMGSVVGERFVRGVHTAIEQKAAFVCFTATGGARIMSLCAQRKKAY